MVELVHFHVAFYVMCDFLNSSSLFRFGRVPWRVSLIGLALCSNLMPAGVPGNGDVLGAANPQVFAAPYFNAPYAHRE